MIRIIHIQDHVQLISIPVVTYFDNWTPQKLLEEEVLRSIFTFYFGVKWVNELPPPSSPSSMACTLLATKRWFICHMLNENKQNCLHWFKISSLIKCCFAIRPVFVQNLFKQCYLKRSLLLNRSFWLLMSGSRALLLKDWYMCWVAWYICKHFSS